MNTIDQLRTKENNPQDWKQYWKETELVPSTREDKQLPFLIKTLEKELDTDKIETVLEVGVGYGRVARGIIEMFPNLINYDGMDISRNAITKSVSYMSDHLAEKYNNIGYRGLVGDFENDRPIPNFYDLVISVETMSTVPENINIEPWIQKMCALSKKYVVNLDYIKTTHPIFNNGHSYVKAYGNVKAMTGLLDTPNPDEKLFICRVK